MKFEDTNLSDNIKRAIKELGYENMTEVQEKTLTPILENKDVVAMSTTGSGKTAAYLLPLIEKINVEDKNVQVLIVTPTRELAIQIVSVARTYLKYSLGINVIALYGGKEVKLQAIALRKGVKVVVGTPGRICNLINNKALKLKGINTLVLDEADEMLSMGFEKEVSRIIENIREDAQKLLFSATIDDRVKDIAKAKFKSPIFIECRENNKNILSSNVRQIAIECKEKMKMEATLRILAKEQARNSIIFCNTKKKTLEVGEFLKKNNVKLEVLNSDIKQEEREKIFKKLRRGELDTIVVTDVLARGIDVDFLDLVINYDIPLENEYYLHRIGRTARNGKSGVAYTFYTGKQTEKIHSIEDYTGSKFEYEDVPRKNTEDVEIDFPLSKRGKYIITINLGKKDSIKAKDIIGAIENLTGIRSQNIGIIEVNEEYSTIEIKEEYLSDIVSLFSQGKIKGKDVNIITKR